MTRLLIGIVAFVACIDLALPEEAAVEQPATTTTTSWPEVRVVPLSAPKEIFSNDFRVDATTTTTTTLPVLVGPDTPCQEWVPTALSVGWPADRVVMEKLLSILWRESRCNADSFNPTDTNGGSRGLAQINGFWCQKWLQQEGVLAVCDELFDPEVNLKAAWHIYQYSVNKNNNGWHPWRV